MPTGRRAGLPFLASSQISKLRYRSGQPRCDHGRPFRPADMRPGDVTDMLHYAVVFFVIALIAALFGFGGIAAGAAGIAKVLFFIFLVLFVVSLIIGLFRRGT